MANRTQETTSTGSNKQRGGRPGGAQSGGMQSGGAQAMSDVAKPVTDPTYGIVSVLYHALQGAQTYQQYSDDARKAGDAELQQFFDNCRQEEHERALQAKSLLMDRLEVDEEGESDEDDDDEDDEEEEEED